jgi:anthranilate synthase component 2
MIFFIFQLALYKFNNFDLKSSLKILIIDNYDSFTFNLFHYVEGLNVEVDVFRNDEFDFSLLPNYDKIILSPGPGLPKDAGDLFKIIRAIDAKQAVLGVCLGMQALAEVYDGELYNMKVVKHGVSMKCNNLNPHFLFEGLPESFEVGLYHSWAVKTPLPIDLEPLLFTEEGILMAMAHKNLAFFGVQFHPESVLTPNGRKVIKNFVDYQL